MLCQWPNSCEKRELRTRTFGRVICTDNFGAGLFFLHVEIGYVFVRLFYDILGTCFTELKQTNKQKPTLLLGLMILPGKGRNT